VWDAHPPEALSEETGASIGQGRAEDRDLRQEVGPKAREDGRSDHHGDTREAGEHARDPVSGHPLVGGEEVGRHHGEQRGGRVQDRGESRGDLGLAPHDAVIGSFVRHSWEGARSM
jgi:hypothetical protein